MVRIHEEFWRKADAEAFWRTYVLEFLPSVYGTVLRVFRDRVAGMWIVSGHRFV